MLEPAETSYFSTPAAGLDPRLFRDGKLQPRVRLAILQLLLNHLNAKYVGANGWMNAWLAGSGVSYQWAAHRDPGDLDCLVGVNFPRFRESNRQFAGLSDKEIASMFNEQFRNELQPQTKLFMGSFELTFYVNVKSNITEIKPYAAYSLVDDDWTVTPETVAPEVNPDWESAVVSDKTQAIDILTRYITAKKRYESASNEAVKANARADMKSAMVQGAMLYDVIHKQRSEAFGEFGSGYTDFNNYRWQAGKRTGVVQSLRHLREELDKENEEFAKSTYGVDLPDASVLVRRAATQRLN